MPTTKVSEKTLAEIMQALTRVPEGLAPISKAQKILQERQTRYQENNLDWALAELLAYGTLLVEGVPVRLSGQDCIRGTFSHRHAEIFDSSTNRSYCNLNHIKEKQARFSVYNSLLSEYAVLGFEYGHSLGRPNQLNIWEAQFGDFANGAQIVIDQFISSGESKWGRMSGLVLYLPHGYEGQGPEHSNARPERFLQLCAESNMIVANFTTPANLFHALRRQVKWNFRKPLIVMTPKSLLRHPQCVSPLEDLVNGEFNEVFVDEVKSKKIRKVLWCSGKVYFDLLEKKQKDGHEDIVLVRLEQLYPLPVKKLVKLKEKYAGAQMVWVQEEPKNMGAWTFLQRYDECMDFKVVARKSSASPAVGLASVHKKELQTLLEAAFA